MASQLYRHLTTTVGLITVKHALGVNLMAAEWTYFVARDPLYVEIGIGDGAYTQGLIEDAGEFAVTLCSASQAGLANFAGSFSGLEVDKTSSQLLELAPSVEIETPRVAGGVLSAECRVHTSVELPEYKLFIGEALAVHLDPEASRDPLVKHGGMYRLGEPIGDDTIAVAAEVVDADYPTLRVAASVQVGERMDAPWTVTLVAPDARRMLVGEVESNEYGDMLADVDVEEMWPDVPVAACRVLVERPDSSPGWAAVSTRLTGSNGHGPNGHSADLASQLAAAPAGYLTAGGKGVV